MIPLDSRPSPLSAAQQQELVAVVFDGQYERVHQDIRDLLLDPIFDPRTGLTLAEAGRLSYVRSRFMHRRLERPLAILRNPLRLFALAEWPSLMDVSTFSLLMVHYNLCLGTLFDHGLGRDDLADEFEELDALTSFGSYMATELGFGNNVAALRTEATYDHATRTFVLHTPDRLARKYMSYSGFPEVRRIAVVLARLKTLASDCGVFPFVVRISDENGLRPGIHAAACPEKPVQGLDNGVTWFDHVTLPQRSLLLGDMGEITEQGEFKPAIGNSRKRFLRAMSRIVPGRLCVSSAAVGAGRASIYIALRYARHRLTNAPGRNDAPVIEYRSHQLATFTSLAKVYAMTLLVNHAKRAFVAGARAVSADLNTLVSIVKALSTWEMTAVVAVCRERCGAQGMFSVNRIADYVSLLQGLVTAEGDNLVLLAAAAGQLLAQSEPGGVAGKRDPSRCDLRDTGWLVALLGFRERTLWSVSREAKERSEHGYFEAWNDIMNPAIAMARLRGVATALQCLHEAAQHASLPDVGPALGLLASLYGLTELQSDAGWYLAHDAITAEQVVALPSLVDSVCQQLLPHADALIAGFALTPELLRAPIAHADYIAAFCSGLNDAAPSTARPAARRAEVAEPRIG